VNCGWIAAGWAVLGWEYGKFSVAFWASF